MNKMEYKEQIKNPQWQKRRLEILSRDNFKCVVCDCDDEELHVHHLYYEKDKKIWEYPDSALITLCGYCHNTEHFRHKGSYKSIYENLSNFKKEYFLTNIEVSLLLDAIGKMLGGKDVDAEYSIAKLFPSDSQVASVLTKLADRRLTTSKVY